MQPHELVRHSTVLRSNQNVDSLLNQSQVIQQKIQNLIPNYQVRQNDVIDLNDSLQPSASKTVQALQHELKMLNQKQQYTNQVLASQLNLNLADMKKDFGQPIKQSVYQYQKERPLASNVQQHYQSLQMRNSANAKSPDKLQSYYDQLLSQSITKGRFSNLQSNGNFNLQLLSDIKGQQNSPIKSVRQKKLGYSPIKSNEEGYNLLGSEVPAQNTQQPGNLDVSQLNQSKHENLQTDETVQRNETSQTDGLAWDQFDALNDSGKQFQLINQNLKKVNNILNQQQLTQQKTQQYQDDNQGRPVPERTRKQPIPRLEQQEMQHARKPNPSADRYVYQSNVAPTPSKNGQLLRQPTNQQESSLIQKSDNQVVGSQQQQDDLQYDDIQSSFAKSYDDYQEQEDSLQLPIKDSPLNVDTQLLEQSYQQPRQPTDVQKMEISHLDEQITRINNKYLAEEEQPAKSAQQSNVLRVGAKQRAVHVPAGREQLMAAPTSQQPKIQAAAPAVVSKQPSLTRRNLCQSNECAAEVGNPVQTSLKPKYDKLHYYRSQVPEYKYTINSPPKGVFAQPSLNMRSKIPTQSVAYAQPSVQVRSSSQIPPRSTPHKYQLRLPEQEKELTSEQLTDLSLQAPTQASRKSISSDFNAQARHAVSALPAGRKSHNPAADNSIGINMRNSALYQQRTAILLQNSHISAAEAEYGRRAVHERASQCAGDSAPAVLKPQQAPQQETIPQAAGWLSQHQQATGAFEAQQAPQARSPPAALTKSTQSSISQLSGAEITQIERRIEHLERLAQLKPQPIKPTRPAGGQSKAMQTNPDSQKSQKIIELQAQRVRETPQLLNFDTIEQKSTGALGEGSLLTSEASAARSTAKYDLQLNESMYREKIYLDDNSVNEYKIDMDWAE